ncbi:Gfo/Idh/MocA family protein [Mucilaginibacter auburnensis]|uniref:Putative dehydrogenase n=1 Tax=Mucilaginibacter auburnensis TaxID=1457233 RepID=A0A2H9VLK0_9SPHI|nr:Gfo/Idh/MocA family oxidoreductase [Mucilaginibacter auburnensis]PJJ79175.1 putative dehydrogenase [Mucilaginibacter auburnensis]
MKTIRWGILGTGYIARRFASDLKLAEGAELAAIGSRSLTSAQQFADEYPVANCFGSYDEVAQCPDVDVVYVATPHTLHYENTLMCLNGGKAVLCEKPFAINKRDTEAMINLAREKKLFLMDALWTKFHPHYLKMLDMVKSGKLGDVKIVFSNFGYVVTPQHSTRLLDPALGGGSILDIGIYNIFTAFDVLGMPDKIDVNAVATDGGVDEQCSVVFTYDNGAMASLYSSFRTTLATEAEVCGTKARVKLTPDFYTASANVELYGENGIKELIEVERENGFGYQYEARHVNECLRAGLTESPVVSHSYTLKLMVLLDKIRGLAGIRYTADEL